MLHKKPFVTLIIITHIAFVFMLIYRQTWFTTLSYKQQAAERQRNELVEKKEALTQQLYRLKNPQHVKKYATHTLGMKKISLKQVKKLPQGNAQ
jgi:cell division protein FtsL